MTGADAAGERRSALTPGRWTRGARITAAELRFAPKGAWAACLLAALGLTTTRTAQLLGQADKAERFLGRARALPPASDLATLHRQVGMGALLHTFAGGFTYAVLFLVSPFGLLICLLLTIPIWGTGWNNRTIKHLVAAQPSRAALLAGKLLAGVVQVASAGVISWLGIALTVTLHRGAPLGRPPAGAGVPAAVGSGLAAIALYLGAATLLALVVKRSGWIALVSAAVAAAVLLPALASLGRPLVIPAAGVGAPFGTANPWLVFSGTAPAAARATVLVADAGLACACTAGSFLAFARLDVRR